MQHTINDVVANIDVYHRAHPEQRRGQAAYNAVWLVLPDIADEVVGTDLDPFFDDRKLGDFLNFVDARL